MFKLVASGIAPRQFGLIKGKVINSRSLTQNENSGGFEEQPSASLLSQVARKMYFFSTKNTNFSKTLGPV